MSENKTIGVIGGGQLGLMLAQAAEKRGLQLNFLDDSPYAPCRATAKKFIVGDLYSAASIKELASISDTLTYETEHVSANTLAELEQAGKQIIPGPAVLQIMQNKILQKEFLFKHQLPTAPFLVAQNWNEVKEKAKQLKGPVVVVKSDVGGYDGKGVWIGKKEEIENRSTNPVGGNKLLIEECIEFEKELAVMIAKDVHGGAVTFPVVEMFFDEQSNMLDYLFCPANIKAETENQIQDITKKIAAVIPSAGLFAIELFLGKDGVVYINEIASRPHNSQHHTIEACSTSQYEQLVCILLGEKVKPVELLHSSAILNVVGPQDFTGHYATLGENEISKKNNIFIHLYNKPQSKPNRKLGHITIVANTMDEVKKEIDFVKSTFKIVRK